MRSPPLGGANENVCIWRAQGLLCDVPWCVWTSIERASSGACVGPGVRGFVPPGVQCAQHGRVAAVPWSSLLLTTLKIFWAGGTTGKSRGHPLGFVRVPYVGPSKSIGRVEWQPHTSAMDGLRPARSPTWRSEDVCCDMADKWSCDGWWIPLGVGCVCLLAA